MMLSYEENYESIIWVSLPKRGSQRSVQANRVMGFIHIFGIRLQSAKDLICCCYYCLIVGFDFRST